MRPEDPVYQARYGSPRSTLFGLSASLAMIALGCLNFFDPQLIPSFLPLWQFLGWGVLFLGSVLSAAIGRQVAFSLDRSGVTFGGHPLRYRATTRHIPWTDIRQIMLWTHEVPLVTTNQGPRLVLARYRYVGLIRYPGAPDLRTGRCSRWLFGTPPTGSPPHITAGTVRRIDAGRLDRAQLELSVSTYAPSIPILDLNPGVRDDKTRHASERDLGLQGGR